jgi:hypothetical protein
MGLYVLNPKMFAEKIKNQRLNPYRLISEITGHKITTNSHINFFMPESFRTPFVSEQLKYASAILDSNGIGASA